MIGQQLQFQLDWPEQTRYELIRPVVVFGSPPVERAKQTGVSARTIYRKVNRFDELSMQSLFEAEPIEDTRILPPSYRWLISRGQGHALVYAFHAPAAAPAHSEHRHDHA